MPLAAPDVRHIRPTKRVLTKAGKYQSVIQSIHSSIIYLIN